MLVLSELMLLCGLGQPGESLPPIEPLRELVTVLCVLLLNLTGVTRLSLCDVRVGAALRAGWVRFGRGLEAVISVWGEDLLLPCFPLGSPT